LADSNVTKVAVLEEEEQIIPIVKFIQSGEESGGNDHTIRKWASRFLLIGGELYKWGFLNPLLKCLTVSQA